MGFTKRIILGTLTLVMGLILFLIKEYYIGLGASIGGIAILIGVSKENIFMAYVFGFYFLIGGILCFFIPSLLFPPLDPAEFMKMTSGLLGVFFIISGIYMIIRGVGRSLGP